MLKLYYIERDLTPVEVTADVVTRHPNQTITFSITSPEWKARTGWKPESHVEVQAEPVGQVNRPDRYYWADPIKVKDTEEEVFRGFFEMFCQAPDTMIDKAYTGLLKRALASDQKIDWVTYAWNLLDMLVHTAGASGVVITSLEIMLEKHPETEVAKANRRQNLTMKSLEFT